ncbi:hypothetical protein ACFX2F_039149 [Malus domestica]
MIEPDVIFSGAILLLLIGFTVTTIVIGPIIFTPIIIFSSLIWVPLGAILVLTVGFFMSMCGFGAAEINHDVRKRKREEENRKRKRRRKEIRINE